MAPLIPKCAAFATAGLAATLLYGAHGPASAKTVKASPTASIIRGKALVSQYRCNGCHGADLAGRKGFSPSLHQSGSLKHYNSATFTRLLLTGVTDDGGHVHPPMPVYGPGGMHMRPGGPPPGRPGGPPRMGMRPGEMHMPPPMTKVQAAAIYAYLQTVK